MIKCGIVGATGYTGVELLRFLATHPNVAIEVVTSRSEAGRPVSDLFASLRGFVDLDFSAPKMEALCACDVVFFATPNGTAMQYVTELLQANVRVIDLAADFRIRDRLIWEQWYGMQHVCPEFLDAAVYGLPEINRAAIREARLVANPGCYPTAVTLGFLPLLKSGELDTLSLIADAKSGITGAGRKAQVGTLMAEAGDSFKAYAVPGHRHLPEIRQTLQGYIQQEIDLTFVPHLLPMLRGIHATLYARSGARPDWQGLFEKHYIDEPFVDVLPAGSHPETRSCRGANVCRIAVHQPQNADTVIVLSVIDNLVKGAAGQAVQNMNIMFSLPETTGLTMPALLP